MSKDQFVDDMTRMFGGAMQNMGVLKQEFESMTQQQLQAMLLKMNMVTRDEFEAAKELLQRVERQQQDILTRLDALEGDKTPEKSSKAKKSTGK